MSSAGSGIGPLGFPSVPSGGQAVGSPPKGTSYSLSPPDFRSLFVRRPARSGDLSPQRPYRRRQDLRLTSVRYRLLQNQHAPHLFYIAPFRSILSQNAGSIQSVLPREYRDSQSSPHPCVLEHHSDVTVDSNSQEGEAMIQSHAEMGSLSGGIDHHCPAAQHLICCTAPKRPANGVFSRIGLDLR